MPNKSSFSGPEDALHRTLTGGLRIGHGCLPRVIWGADAPGARDVSFAIVLAVSFAIVLAVSFAIVPAALILMGDWNVPAWHDSHVIDDPGA